MKRIIAIMMAVTMMAALAGCAPAEPAAEEAPADDWAYIQGNGKMVIGITEFAPMNYYDENGKLIGFETEFAEAVCEKLGVKPEFVVINWDTKEVELEAKNIDCIWNGFTMNDERREAMEFTSPYVKNMQVVVIKAADADKYTDTASLAGASLIAEVSSAGEQAIADDENLSKAGYVAAPKQADALLEVKAGTADAAVLDYVMANAMVGEGTDYSDLMMIDGLELSAEEYGVAFRKDSNVAAMVNEKMSELMADGTLPALGEKYGLNLIAE